MGEQDSLFWGKLRRGGLGYTSAPETPGWEQPTWEQQPRGPIPARRRQAALRHSCGGSVRA